MSHGTGIGPTSLARLRAALRNVEWLLLYPVLVTGAWLLGLEALTMALVILLPVLLALDGRLGRRPGAQSASHLVVQPLDRLALQRIVDDTLADCTRRDRTTAVLHAQIDDLHIADGEWGTEISEKVMDRVIQRITTAMRGADIVMRTGYDGAVVVLAPTRRADLDVVMSIVDRIQAAVAQPISIEGRSIRVHACIGICSEGMAPARSGAAMLAAADCALRMARQQGNDAIRAFNPDMQAQVETDHRLALQIDDALESGQIRPWFQPQINALTGCIAGFEALVRWHHPDLGILSPAQFLPTIHSAGKSAELGEQVLKASLDALTAWDAAGIDVPCVGVNVSLEQLADPRMAERVIWQLDRHDMEPGRLAIEILETVTLRDADEAIMRNVMALRKAGFRLDLDDFGTGAASIAHIAKFGVHRIKIDRSFVAGIDSDPTKQEIVRAILGLAESLSIETLAEGVETPEEKATLVEMGCPHLQGDGIARPMPFEKTTAWARALQPHSNAALRNMHPQGTA
ncbi:bifunctional diguanylate cyclase/phosphodiesterase [uncultured Jannaschia sp.]|uniref:putative bifunctional diguanylate cyclase/phosphodiesterase n=1 Tax=uncultured Jannaschia sp. TaxID=293347 RepID=UPI00262CEF05|nr:bifunctional diguanylate cyclase/phosphodiesterase [uncultured Jannaschia sp.]